MTDKIIGGKRCCGKTTELIKKASAEHLYILCPNKGMAKIIFNQAKDMGLDIPFPITIEDLPLHNPHIKEVLIDEVEMVLQQLIGIRVAEMSTSYHLEELPSLRREDTQERSSLLTIELEDESSVPKVFYQGEEVTNKVRVSFNWDTREESPLSGGTRYNIEHFVKCIDNDE
ncbi:hypothetical protein [Virgibacillus pantothenticus]|uniref:Uncharacterized protein n=1 Tax=Virgibacillus pantothenticus TaxID=1473 RepID=A0A0L0QM74_VIRPA|nr:hypothetical protein [Virgibacillus pantothenticus]KNE19661.1 hypothetical protein AFK71_14480 [Virgibacillus pantothenticus]MED3736635.1 hypothetical protein [Virgibacillus pantothenticus]QTY14810.1 hypothetical protein KBP50_12805 [Virgibacillus pantothenticus]SIS79474.1 hypothetical protein SAMN05421787_103270 [Virgibacillus pantothenticus]